MGDINVSYFKSLQNAKRKQFLFPESWTFDKSQSQKRERLDSMTADPNFFPLVMALLSDGSWYSKALVQQQLQHQKDTIRFVEPNLHPRVSAAIILSKKVLDLVYTDTGCLNKDLLTRLLNRRFDQSFAFEKYSTECSVSLWQVMDLFELGPLQSLLTYKNSVEPPLKEFKNQCADSDDDTSSTTTLETSSTTDLEDNAHSVDKVAEESVDYSEAQSVDHVAAQPEFVYSVQSDTVFQNSTAYVTDSFCYLLRSTICVTGSIQRLHNTFLDLAENSPTRFTGFARKSHLTAKEEIWYNYYFDLGAMWMLLKHFNIALRTIDANLLIHALDKAKKWTLSGGLLQSTAGLMRFEKKACFVLQKIHKVAGLLHSMYLRLWPLGLQLLNLKLHAGNKSSRDWTFGYISANVFLCNPSAKIKMDLPNCGTAVLVDLYDNLSILRPKDLGLSVERPDGSTVELFCDSALDHKYCVFIGFLAITLTQTEVHLWSAVSDTRPWTTLDGLDKGLPTLDEIDSHALAYIQNKPDVFTYTDLKKESKAYRHTILKTKEDQKRKEIEELLKNL